MKSGIASVRYEPEQNHCTLTATSMPNDPVTDPQDEQKDIEINSLVKRVEIKSNLMQRMGGSNRT